MFIVLVYVKSEDGEPARRSDRLAFNNITHAIEECVKISTETEVDKCWLIWKDDRLAVYRNGREAPS